MATAKSLFPMAPEWSVPRSIEMESLIDSTILNGIFKNDFDL